MRQLVVFTFSQPRGVLAALMIVGALYSAPPKIWSFDNDNQWNNLATLNRRATYTFIDRNHSCFEGMIKQVDDRAVTITRRNSPEIATERRNLLRVTWGAWAGGVIFSGRSSWSDVVRIVGRRFHPDIAVVMKSGQEHKGKLFSASDTTLTLESSRKNLDINKDEVSTVSYIRSKPLSDSAAYADDELAWMKVFDPQLWPRLLHLQSPLSVRLYDASSREDTSSIVCRFGLDVMRTAR